MNDSYGIANEAVKFTQTEFGKHHLARLERVRDDYRRKAEDVSVSESQSRAFSLKASAYDDELSYFHTAEQIVSNPGIVKKLKDKIKEVSGSM